METSGALKLLQELLEAEENNEDVIESDCEEYNNAVASVPSSLFPKTIIASLISRANSVLSNEESEHADSSIDDDGDDPDYVPSTKTSLITENDSFTVTENGSPSVKTNQNALVTRSPASRPSRSQDTDNTGPVPRPGTSQDNDTTGPALIDPVRARTTTGPAQTNPKKRQRKPDQWKKCKEEQNT
ncbi:hypothetical protein RRG08_066796 [Elysia crispata]|uniref:Uncharacterized protein n=1 Tax=Elysia crispata TaxID=231223 RepID=A0AAE0XPD5_9GAST|nr:hypothetical protein RRG08_066796 [Elysia crispata]